MNNLTAVVFYFPHHDVGGVPVLFLRLADYLKDIVPVYVADYSNGYMARNLPDRVGLIRIDKDDTFPQNSLFVFQSFLPWRFPFLSKVDKNSRVLFWNLHPKCFSPDILNASHENYLISAISKLANLFAGSRQKKIAALVHYLMARQALVFMDRENATTTGEYVFKDLGVKKYLPVPVPSLPLPSSQRHNRLNNTINCTWIGRICDFKYHILEHLIVRLSKTSESLGSILLTVIGDGEFLTQVQRSATIWESESFKVEFKGNMLNQDLAKFLAAETDIVFSMGTSSLEAARLGIPVFLTDYSYKKIVGNYKFKLLFDNFDFCLGEQISPQHLEAFSTLENTLADVLNNYDLYAAKCHEYWKSNFSLDVVGPEFINRCKITTATFDEMEKNGFFQSDLPGRLIRSVLWFCRGHQPNEIVGFRHDN